MIAAGDKEVRVGVRSTVRQRQVVQIKRARRQYARKTQNDSEEMNKA